MDKNEEVRERDKVIIEAAMGKTAPKQEEPSPAPSKALIAKQDAEHAKKQWGGVEWPLPPYPDGVPACPASDPRRGNYTPSRRAWLEKHFPVTAKKLFPPDFDERRSRMRKSHAEMMNKSVGSFQAIPRAAALANAAQIQHQLSQG